MAVASSWAEYWQSKSDSLNNPAAYVPLDPPGTAPTQSQNTGGQPGFTSPGFTYNDPIGTGPSFIDGGPTRDVQFNPQLAASDQSAANLAAQFGATVVQANILSQNTGPFTAPNVNFLKFPNGSVINAGLLAQWADIGRWDLINNEIANAPTPEQGAAMQIPGYAGQVTPANIPAPQVQAWYQGNSGPAGWIWVDASYARLPGAIIRQGNEITPIVPPKPVSDPTATAAAGNLPRTQSGQQPTTVPTSQEVNNPPDTRGTGLGTLPAGAGNLQPALQASGNDPSPAAPRQYAAGDTLAPRILALVKDPFSVQSLDTWGYYYGQATGTPAPAPESLGFTGAARSQPTSFQVWYSALSSYLGTRTGGAVGTGTAPGFVSTLTGGSQLNPDPTWVPNPAPTFDPSTAVATVPAPGGAGAQAKPKSSPVVILGLIAGLWYAFRGK